MMKKMTAIQEMYHDQMIKGKAKSWDYYLEKEKQNLIEAYEVGNNDYANFNYVGESGEDYYEITYQSKEKEEDKVEEEEEQEPPMCSSCSGTGMGSYDGSSCYSCNGRGY